MEQAGTVLLEHYDDINCDVYVKFNRINGEIINRRYIVVWANAISRGNECLHCLGRVTVLINKLRKLNTSVKNNQQSHSGDKIVKMVILEGKWGEWNV